MGMAGKLASQFRGLSEAQFYEAYGTEAQCRAVVEKLRWPEGFVCPLCGGCEGKWLSTRPKVQCRACRHQVSLTAGTIFHATKLPLTSWFLAMWLVATAKNGISSVELEQSAAGFGGTEPGAGAFSGHSEDGGRDAPTLFGRSSGVRAEGLRPRRRPAGADRPPLRHQRE